MVTVPPPPPAPFPFLCGGSSPLLFRPSGTFQLLHRHSLFFCVSTIGAPFLPPSAPPPFLMTRSPVRPRSNVCHQPPPSSDCLKLRPFLPLFPQKKIFSSPVGVRSVSRPLTEDTVSRSHNVRRNRRLLMSSLRSFFLPPPWVFEPPLRFGLFPFPFGK